MIMIINFSLRIYSSRSAAILVSETSFFIGIEVVVFGLCEREVFVEGDGPSLSNQFDSGTGECCALVRPVVRGDGTVSYCTRLGEYMLERRGRVAWSRMWMDHCPWRGIVGCRCCLVLLQICVLELVEGGERSREEDRIS